MIRIIVAINLLFILTPLIGNTQTVDLSTLSDNEKGLHRWGWCVAIWLESPFDLNSRKIGAIDRLLEKSGVNSRSKDPRNIYRKSKDDAEKQLILGEILVNQTLLDECDRDMKLILKEKYIPHFSYMKD